MMSLCCGWEPVESWVTSQLFLWLSNLPFNGCILSNGYSCPKLFNLAFLQKWVLQALEISFVIIEILNYSKVCNLDAFLCSNKKLLETIKAPGFTSSDKTEAQPALLPQGRQRRSHTHTRLALMHQNWFFHSRNFKCKMLSNLNKFQTVWLQ